MGTKAGTPSADRTSERTGCREDQGLSRKEQAVFRLLSSEATADKIALQLNCSVGTVKSHMRSIYKKLDIHKRSEAAILAYEWLKRQEFMRTDD